MGPRSTTGVFRLCRRPDEQTFSSAGRNPSRLPDPDSLLKRGVTRFRFMVFTTYGACPADFTRPATRSIPSCLSDGDLPRIPPGRYFTTVEWRGTVRPPQPKRVEVTFLAAR
jgi:hypothetical protein